MILPAPMTGPELRMWRMRKGLTVDQASAMIGVERTTWWRWEKRSIRHPLLVALAIESLGWGGTRRLCRPVLKRYKL